ALRSLVLSNWVGLEWRRFTRDSAHWSLETSIRVRDNSIRSGGDQYWEHHRSGHCGWHELAGTRQHGPQSLLAQSASRQEPGAILRASVSCKLCRPEPALCGNCDCTPRERNGCAEQR